MNQYFKNSKSWYYFKYVSHIRFLILIASITVLMVSLMTFVFYIVQQEINGQERVVKVIKIDYNLELHPSIQKIEKHYHSNDINILRYSIESYLNNFEVYEKADNYYVSFIEKMKHMQKFSSRDVVKTFQDNFTNEYSTKLKNNAFVKMQIKSIKLNIAEESLVQKLRNLLIAQGIPDQATIEAVIYIFDGKKLQKKPVTIQMEFYFEKIQKGKGDHYNNIKFFVTSYSYIH